MSSAEKSEPNLETLESFQQALSRPLYTTFSSKKKHSLNVLLGLTTITSPLTATIYFPLLPLLADHYRTSAQAINLTITIYIVFQALSPAIFATLSDSLGRRFVFLVTLTIYVVSNLGLALEHNSYAALIVLRALQSLGASAAFAISYGVIADVCVPSERGKMVGPVSMTLNLGTCVGPVVGGWVAFKSGSYTWVFWFLVIVGATLLLVVGTFLPETARNVVGNGAVPISRWWERAWGPSLSKWVYEFRRKHVDSKSNEQPRNSDEMEGDEEGTPISNAFGIHHPAKGRSKNFNPLSCLRIIFWKDAAPILWVHGSYYLVDYSIQTSIPSSFKEIYHFNELEIGLSYLPRGVGIILGGYVTGRLMDKNYKSTARKIGHTIDQDRGDDLNQFPIEKARTRGAWLHLGLLTCNLIGYGWALHQRSHVSIPLILQFIQGFLCTSIYIFSSTLLVDVFPESPSTAAAAASIIRCGLAATGVAAVQPLVSVMGRRWYFTALGLLSGAAGCLAIWTIQTWGMRWRSERVAKTCETHSATPEETVGANDQRLAHDSEAKQARSDAAASA